MIELKLLQFGMGMTDGTLISWHKRRGDAVTRGEIVAEVEAAKAVVEIQAPCDGVLAEILVPENTTVPVHTVLARIDNTA
jgi:pyruvate/2-oxoglutarate dehydrogenase complex dihydrolipoamide acyltransferase (E2) component